jgi:hypothetical protein
MGPRCFTAQCFPCSAAPTSTWVSLFAAGRAGFSLNEGDLVLFPAFLPHKAMPYAGELDGIIVSFNA